MLTFDLSKIQLPDHGLMLDLGCGEGRHVFAVMEAFPNIQCVGLDPHLESLDKSLEGLEYFESISNNQTSFLSGSAYCLIYTSDAADE